MLIAIISDIHDNLANLNKCLHWCKKHDVQKIICCGDVSNLNTLSHLSKEFPQEIFLVKGNNKLYKKEDIKMFPNIHYYGDIGYLEIEKVKISFCHERKKIQKIKNYNNFIFYGHSHKPS